MKIREEEYTREFGQEVESMLLDHMNEIKQLDMPIDIDHIAYIRAYNADHLVVVTARDEGELIGYIGFVVAEDWNYSAVVSKEVGFYLKEKYRKGRTAIKMIKFAEKVLKERGVNAVMMMSSAEKNVGRLYEYMKYREVETSYIKEL